MPSSASGPSGSGSGPPAIPKRTLSKRVRIDLEKEYHYLSFELEEARKKVQPSTSFDAQYWTSAAHLRAETNIAVREWVDKGEGPAASWWATTEARRIIEQIKAATLERSLYTRQAERIQQGGPIRRAFQAMFTTSQLGICVDKVDIGPRKRCEQARFKDDLIQFYGAATMWPNKPTVILSLGPDVLVSLFGEDVEGELMTVCITPCIMHTLTFNCRHLVESGVESALDDGAIAIVPDLPDDPTTEQVVTWEREEPKNYRWHIIDDEAQSLETF
ncbi:hypothetical protein B0T25DRAFT_528701, partial [Lasiosphaeria hispida]